MRIKMLFCINIHDVDKDKLFLSLRVIKGGIKEAAVAGNYCIPEYFC